MARSTTISHHPAIRTSGPSTFSHDPAIQYLGVTGHSEQGHVYAWHRARGTHAPGQAERRTAMGIDWMTRVELAQAIPPAYTEYLGGQLLAALA